MPSQYRLAHSHPRLAIALIAGTLVTVLSPHSWTSVTRLLAGWDVLVWSYLILMGWLMTRTTHAHVRKIAEEEDTRGVAVLVLLSLSAVLSIAAIVLELARAQNLSNDMRLIRFGITGSTVIGSWLFIAIVYTVHYARLFYRSPPAQRCLRFPENTQTPDYWDFMYFSVTIAVAAQTSDVSVMSGTLRKAVLAQSVLSFLFNAAIIGLSINIVAGLAGK